ncbi:MAG: heme exporter protein CcmD [Rhizobiaceae bacterium]|nr:heme exporter protein CcmD [Rhizobiaceae bacterium]
MSALFGAKYFGFILSAFGITAAVLLALTIWIVLVHKSRLRQLDALEKAGIKRASRPNG